MFEPRTRGPAGMKSESEESDFSRAALYIAGGAQTSRERRPSFETRRENKFDSGRRQRASRG
jgi:hypothetical protein